MEIMVLWAFLMLVGPSQVPVLTALSEQANCEVLRQTFVTSEVVYPGAERPCFVIQILSPSKL